MVPNTIPVLNHGFVRLDDSMADDLSVINSARVSFNTRHEEMEDGDDKLINFLMKNRHGTPFEHNSFRFHVKAPLFVFREWQRHRISSYNEWSARYSELKNEFYIPETLRTQVGKPGSYTFSELKDGNSEVILEMMAAHDQRSFDQYRVALSMGVAKEQARLFLPVSIYSEMYWTVNARSLMNFLSLRNSEQAMWEIRQYAIAVEDLFKSKMPVTAAVFEANERVAP
jgi:thymidylate synthase (FAD)